MRSQWDKNPVEPQGQGSLVEPKLGAAKAEPTGQWAKMERRDLRPEVESQDPLAQMLLLAHDLQLDVIAGLHGNSAGL